MRVIQVGAACIVGLTAVTAPVQAGLITFIDDLAGWETEIGGAGAITGTEDFNSFATDVSGHSTTITLPLFSITSSSSTSSLINLIDVLPYVNSQANQDGTPSFLGLKNVTIDFTQNLTALGFGYLDIGGSTQNYGLQVNFVGSGSSTFLLGNPSTDIFIGLVADGGMLIDSITWVLPESPSPFSVDNFRLVAAPSTPVPEPSTLALFAFGLVGLGFFGWWRRAA